MDHLSKERVPSPPELFRFSAEEAEIAVMAVGYYVSSLLQTLEANWDSQGYHAFACGAEGALKNLEDIADFVKSGQALAQKIASHGQNPDSVLELDDSDLDRLGSSLFHLGNSGFQHASQAMEARGEPKQKLEELQERSRSLFSSLEPVAKAKDVSWMVWE